MTQTVDPLPDQLVDAVVIGGGAAGLNGALMLARSRRCVVVIDSSSPRNAPAEAVHGLLALDGTPPAELYRRGREEVRGYGGHIVAGTVTAAHPATPVASGDLRFTVQLADGRSLTARRLLVATGVRDVLADIPGLAQYWGTTVVHCPYCHGWEVRDEPIGVIAVGQHSVHHALLFRQLSEDIVYFSQGVQIDDESRARLAARGIRVIEEQVREVVSGQDGQLCGVLLADGQVVQRRVIATMGTMVARTEGLEGLGLPLVATPGEMGTTYASHTWGATAVPGVWVAGNVTDATAQVGAAAAAGAVAGAHLNAHLAFADADAEIAVAQEQISATQ